ncbi:unnamed protein product [Cuscuta epithymum]|uniref:F-box domain-containing protein n=1 Tax=Cuscuta epithymum TaxID=186058 RepID=A0AAV0DCD9_9ASTE|nr:unnamed protein product [Cuscuta epithymum]
MEMSSKPNNNSSLHIQEEHKTLMDFFSTGAVFLPKEIFLEILTRLPAKPLVRFKCVSKFFYSLIAEPLFVKVHHDRSSTRPNGTQILLNLPFPDQNHFYTLKDTGEDKGMLQANQVHYLEGQQFKNLNMWSQANGLICLFNNDGDVSICNPSTRQHISFPRAATSPKSQIYTCSILGFDPVSEKYKVLKLQIWNDLFSGYLKRQHCVLTLGVDKSWREISNVLVRYPDAGVHIGGIIYLIVSSINKHQIVTFNVGDENIGSVPFPGIEVKKYPVPTSLRLSWMEIDGRLAVVHMQSNSFAERVMDIWTLEKSMKWEKHSISVPWEESLIVKDAMDIVSTCTNLGEIVLFIQAWGCLRVLIYSIRKHLWRKLEVCGLHDYLYDYHRRSHNAVDFIQENLYFFSQND